jgi:protein gp37
MAEATNIEWCDSTWSAWIGCTKVSTEDAGGGACDNCYAEALNKRFNGGQNWGPGAPRRRTSDANWRMPLSWNRNAISFLLEHGRNRRVFLNNQADIFDNEVDDALRAEVFDLIEATPHLDWLLLTKRIGNAKRMLPARWLEVDGWPKNVRLGITVCNQPEYLRDASKLFALGCPNFVSIEPMLGPMDLAAVPYTDFGSMIDWAICGGESGNGARPMHPDWVRALRDQCEAAGVPFLLKQWGEWAPPSKLEDLRFLGDMMRAGKAVHAYGSGREPDGHFRKGDDHLLRVGKKAAGRALDGALHDGYPA